MMNYIWEKVRKQGWNELKMQKVFLVCSVLAFCILGAIAWLLVGRFYLSDLSWLICFVGYPGMFIGFFGGILFLWKKA